MAIKFLDEQPQKTKIRFLDEKPKIRFLDETKNDSFEPAEAGKQFLIGMGNSIAFGLPSVFAKKKFEELKSENTGEQVARGVGTAVGFTVGAPAKVFSIGAKLAVKGLAKTSPKIAQALEGGSPVIKSMVEGAGGGALFSAVDPTIPVEEKPKAVLSGMAGGAMVGATLSKLPEVIRAVARKDKLPLKTKSAIKEATEESGDFLINGEKIVLNPRTDLVPSYKQLIPKDARNVLEDLNKRQTEILAADRGIVPIKEQVANAWDAGTVNKFYSGWKPGTTVPTEGVWGMTLDFMRGLKNIGEKATPAQIEELSSKVIKADAVVSELARAMGARSQVLQVARDELGFMVEQIKKLDPSAQGAARRLLKQFQTPNFWDKFLEYRTAALLTSPFTHVRNTVGNSIARVFSPTEKAVAGGWNAIESAFTGKARERFVNEGYADLVGAFHGIKPAIRNAINALKDEKFISDDRLLEAVRFKKAIPGAVGSVIRTPFRALGAMDEFFTTLGHNASLYSQATRQALKEGVKNVPSRVAELVRKPSIEMIERAGREAIASTYRQPLSGATASIQQAIAKNPLGRFIVPFFRTPINLFNWTFDRAPTSIISPRNWKAMVRGTPEQRAEAVARIGVGQAVTGGIAMLALDGTITGRLSGKQEKREALMRQGVMPYSIRIGDKYISYRGYEPIASWIGLVANTIEISKEEKKNLDSSKAVEVVMETIKLMKDNSFLRGIADLMNVITDPERYSEQWLKNQATSVIPTGLGYLKNLNDPIIREPGSIPESIKAKLPGFSRGVPPKLDVWGRPIALDGTLTQRALLPGGVTTTKPDMTESELLSLDRFPAKIMKRYKGIKLTVQERNEVTITEGKITKQLLDRLVQSPQFQKLTTEEKDEAVDKVIASVRKEVRKPFSQKIFLDRYRSAKTEEERINLLENFTGKTLFKR